jgi:hypothetical protein
VCSSDLTFTLHHLIIRLSSLDLHHARPQALTSLYFIGAPIDPQGGKIAPD